MARLPAVYRFERKVGLGVVLTGAMSIVSGVLLLLLDVPLRWGDTLSLLLIAPGVPMIAIGAWWAIDRRPKVTLDGHGITDHRAAVGEVRVAWGDITDLEGKVRGVGRGRLVVHLRGGSDPPTRVVDLDSLDQPPEAIIAEAKRRWAAVSGTASGSAAEGVEMADGTAAGKPPVVWLAKGQVATLGCGTMLLILLVAAMFGRGGSGDVGREVRGLRSEVGELKKAVEAQSAEIRQLRDQLPPPKAGGGKAKG